MIAAVRAYLSGTAGQFRSSSADIVFTEELGLEGETVAAVLL